MSNKGRKLRAGDWVEVRSKVEILKTLDQDGRLDGMPFMPEMLAFCGQRFQVYKRAHKTCDTVFPVRGRRVVRAVHLETRCDGQAHGGCQAGCLLFWKEQWLRRVEPSSQEALKLHLEPRSGPPATLTLSSVGCTESALLACTQERDSDGKVSRFVCQATRLPYATKDLEWWDIRQYIEDYTSGNVGLWRIFSGALFRLSYKLSQAGIKLGAPIRWFYDKFYPLWRGSPYPMRGGVIPEGDPTPALTLDLQPGELVRVKSYKAILETLTVGKKNRGMFWDAEMVPYCGGTYRVLKRVDHIIDEKTGNMVEMKTPCIILDNVICQARYAHCRMFCPRSFYPYWREIWLERVEPKAFESRPRIDQ